MRQWMPKSLMVLVLFACGGGPGEREREPGEVADASPGGGVEALPGTPEGTCRATSPLRPLPAEVHEASGAAPSRRHADIFWTHNDSGQPEVFAVSASGVLTGRVRVSGATVTDWEDVAVGPCPAGDCLYIADIGDNRGRRPHVTVYRVPEPGPAESSTRPAEALRLRYPDGPHDAEAMFVLDGTIYIVTKGETGPITLYRAPGDAAPGRPAVLERVRDLERGEQKRKDRITGASASPDGRWVALRTLNALWIHEADDFVGAGVGEPRETDLSALGEPQGEGVGFGAGGTVVLTSEGGGKNTPATFVRMACELD